MRKSNERYTVISDYETGGELFVEPSSNVTIVLIVLSTISLLAYVVKVFLFSFWSLRHEHLLLNILVAIVIIEPVIIAAKSGIIATYYVAYRAMMLSASVKITLLEMIQLATTLSSIALFGSILLKDLPDLSDGSDKLVDMPKVSLAIGALWLCGAFILYVTTIITTQTFVPDYR